MAQRPPNVRSRGRNGHPRHACRWLFVTPGGHWCLQKIVSWNSCGPSRERVLTSTMQPLDPRGRDMRRREFITLFGGVVTLPLTAKAQRTLPVIGFLHEGLPAPAHLTAGFRLGLVEAGVSENGITIENRWAEGQYDRLPALAADLIEHRCRLSRCCASGKGCD